MEKTTPAQHILVRTKQANAQIASNEIRSEFGKLDKDRKNNFYEIYTRTIIDIAKIKYATLEIKTNY